MKKVLLITGSPRPKGNSNSLAAAFASGAVAAGNEVKLFEAATANMSGCHGEGNCEKNGCCGLPDDGQKMNELMRWADVMVLVSPVYWGGFTAQIKTVIDRFYQFNFPKGRETLGVKEAYLIGTAAMPDIKAFDDMVHCYEHVCGLLNITMSGNLLCYGLAGEDALVDHPEYMEEAVKMGMHV